MPTTHPRTSRLIHGGVDGRFSNGILHDGGLRFLAESQELSSVKELGDKDDSQDHHAHNENSGDQNQIEGLWVIVQHEQNLKRPQSEEISLEFDNP